MSWALIDDQSTFHAKVVAAGNAAWGACVRMIAWSMSHLTDGRVPLHVAKLIANDDELASLTHAGLIDARENEIEIHDFLEWNKSAKQIRKERAAKQNAGKRGGINSGKSRSRGPSKAEARAQADAQAPAWPSGSEIPNPSPLLSSPLLSNPKEEDPRQETGGRLALAAEPKRTDFDDLHAHYLAVRKAHNPRTRTVKPSPADRQRVRALLARDYSLDDLKLSVDGLFLSEHHVAEGYLDLQYALRDANLSKFIALGEAQRAREAPRPSRGLRDVPTPEELANVDHAAVAATIRAARERLQAQLVSPPDDETIPLPLLAGDTNEAAQ